MSLWFLPLYIIEICRCIGSISTQGTFRVKKKTLFTRLNYGNSHSTERLDTKSNLSDMGTFLLNSGVFVTNFDTKKIIVTNIRVKIQLHNYLSANGKSQLFLHVTANKKRERIPLRIYIFPKDWNSKAEISKNHDVNLLVGQVKARASEILNRYRLSDIEINVEKFKKDFNATASMTSFYSFISNFYGQF